MCMGLDHDRGLILVRPSLMILVWTFLDSSLASFLWRGSEILFPILRRPTTIGVNIVHLLGVASLVVMRWPRGFIMLGPFLLLFELVEVQGLQLAELGEFFIQFWLGLRSLPNQVIVQGSGAKGFDGLSNDLIVGHF
jgi:hypothetical protein